MSNTAKKLLALLLAAVMTLSCVTVFSSCADNGDGGDDTQGEKNTEEAATKDVYSELEKTKFGRSFLILTRDDYKDNFYIEAYGAEGNDILDDGIYERNQVIETDFGTTIEIYEGGDYTAVNSAVMSQVTSGLDEYDTFTSHKYTFSSCAQNNYLMDMNSVETIDLTHPWWDAACRDNLTVYGKTVLMTGDILPSSLQASSNFVFNKKLLRDLEKEEPYDAVKQGKWTVGLFNELSADVTNDLNGDAKIDYQNDRYGMTTWMMDVPYSMYYGAGGMFVTINEDGAPELSFEQEDMFNIYALIYQGLITQQAYYVTDGSIYMTTYDPFIAGRALFCDMTLSKLSFLQDMEQDYGIIPVPKYDEYQKEYLSFVNGAAAMVGILNTEKDAEFVGTILEAMSAYNYVHITPNMYEIVTKLKAARDPQSSEMVDYLIRNRIYDFGYWFDLAITDVVRQQLMNKKAEISSAVKSATKSSQNALKKIVKAYESSDR